MFTLDQHYIKIHLSNQLIGNRTYQFSPKDSISDLRNAICQNTQLLMYENFHFSYQNRILSEFLQMGEILISGAKLNIVFKPFDQRSSKYHYNKIKSILDNPSILINHSNIYIDETINRRQNQFIKNKLTQTINSFIVSLRQQKIFQSIGKQIQYKFSEWIHYSGYNPVPYYRKLMGDYYYICFKSPQQIDYHITAHSQGFFINQSTNSHFNPNHSPKYPKIYISLLQLMYNCSSKFKQQFKQCINKIKNHQYQKSNIGSLSSRRIQWMKQKIKSNSVNINTNNHWKINPIQRTIKRQDFFTIKDWNQMFQIQHLQPSQNFYQKIDRQKLKFKIYQQFVDHAKIGALNIVQKQILPVNPNCNKKQQTFICTNIYFSYVDTAFEQKDLINLLNTNDITEMNKQYKKQSKLTNNYILNLQQIDNLQQLDLHLSHSVLLQYKGHKLRAQSFPSSIIHTKKKDEMIESTLQRKNILNDNKKCKNFPITHKEFKQNILKLTYKLNIVFDNVAKQKQSEHAKKFIINDQIKGFQTIDKRKYIFNLQCLHSKDYNFLQKQNDYYIYRPQLIHLYNEKTKCKISLNTMLSKTASQKYQLYQTQKLKSQQKKLKSIAAFAKQNIINLVINLLQGDLKKYLSDTKNIVQIMHKYGLNCRYLGFMIKKVDNKKSPHLIYLLQKVIYVKCIKNILNTALKSTSSSRQVTAHILNCIFYPNKTNQHQYNKINKQQQQQNQNNDINKKKKKKNKQKQKDDGILTISSEQSLDFFLTIKPQQLSKLINKIAKIKFNYTFYENNTCNHIIQPAIFKFSYGKSSLLRDICLNVGLIIQKKDYFNVSNANRASPFLSQNILNFNIRTTHTNPDKKQLQRLILQGDNFLSQFHVQQSIQCYNKAIQYILSAFGGNNQKLPIIHKKLSFIYFKIGDIQTALLFGTHSLSMFEQFFGLQHVQTIDNLALLGFQFCAERNFQQAEKCLFKALYYSYLSYSELYPEILTLWLNLSTVYQIQKLYPQAIMCLIQSLKISIKIYNQNHFNTAIIYTALASLHFQIPDIRQSILFKQKSLNILKNLLPETDNRVKQSVQILQHYKLLQSSKKIKQVHQKQQRKITNSFINANKNIMMYPKAKYQDYFMMKEGQEFWRRNKKNKLF